MRCFPQVLPCPFNRLLKTLSAWPGSRAPLNRDLEGALYKFCLTDWLHDTIQSCTRNSEQQDFVDSLHSSVGFSTTGCLSVSSDWYSPETVDWFSVRNRMMLRVVDAKAIEVVNDNYKREQMWLYVYLWLEPQLKRFQLVFSGAFLSAAQGWLWHLES